MATQEQLAPVDGAGGIQMTVPSGDAEEPLNDGPR